MSIEQQLAIGNLEKLGEALARIAALESDLTALRERLAASEQKIFAMEHPLQNVQGIERGQLGTD